MRLELTTTKTGGEEQRATCYNKLYVRDYMLFLDGALQAMELTITEWDFFLSVLGIGKYLDTVEQTQHNLDIINITLEQLFDRAACSDPQAAHLESYVSNEPGMAAVVKRFRSKLRELYTVYEMEDDSLILWIHALRNYYQLCVIPYTSIPKTTDIRATMESNSHITHLLLAANQTSQPHFTVQEPLPLQQPLEETQFDQVISSLEHITVHNKKFLIRLTGDHTLSLDLSTKNFKILLQLLHAQHVSSCEKLRLSEVTTKKPYKIGNSIAFPAVGFSQFFSLYDPQKPNLLETAVSRIRKKWLQTYRLLHPEYLDTCVPWIETMSGRNELTYQLVFRPAATLVQD